jgi:hypothetical protein
VEKLEEELLQILAEEEAVRQRLTLLRDGAEQDPPQSEAKPETLMPLSRLARRVVIVTLVVIGLIAAITVVALGDETRPRQTVVLLDLSTSTASNDEFERNRTAVEGILRRIDEVDHRVVILGIGEESFGTRALLDATSPATAGRYQERLTHWRNQAIQRWRRNAAGLSASASCSDLFGALGRASLAFEEYPARQKRLILLSDMRHACRGFNLEKPIADPGTLLRQVERAGFIPPLKGVSVLVLGTHTAGIDEQYWRRLQVFWTEYFRKAGADLQCFIPSRHLPKSAADAGSPQS